jgi:hypothetical protein
VGRLPLDLPEEVLFEVLACVPIMELGRLLRQRFVVAIKSVFLEMASQAVRRACDLNEQGAVGDSPYEQAFKIRFIVCPPCNYPRGIEEAYSARYCQWRRGPLSQEDPLEMHIDSPWPSMSAEWNTWVEGGRKYQPGLPFRPPGTWWGEADMEVKQPIGPAQ